MSGGPGNETCPLCSADLVGDPIPEKYRQHDADCTSAATGVRCYCLPYGETTHFGRVIGHEVSGIYDGVLFWSCPDCCQAWPRDWPAGVRREQAERCAAWFNASNKRAAATR